MHPARALTRLGGAADHSTLLRVTTRRRLRSALARGEIARVAHGRYTLPTADEGLRAAARLTGVASHLSAAAQHGWKLAHPPERPSVIVPRNRKLPPRRRDGVDVYWRDLADHERHGLVTEPHRTVLDCAKDLPFAQATPLAANPFESVLRAIALDVPGLAVEPQVWIEERGFCGRPDLVDRRRRLVLEADSFEFHGSRKALHRDCERYNALVIRGWTVLRFSWEHVMLQPEYVRDLLVAWAQGPDERATLPPTLLWTA